MTATCLVLVVTVGRFRYHYDISRQQVLNMFVYVLFLLIDSLVCFVGDKPTGHTHHFT